MKIATTPLLFLSCLVIPGLRADDWTEFRGPGGQGHAKAEGLPVEWDPETNVTWRKELPGLAWSSPIVIGSRVFLTNAVEKEGGGVSLRVLALDAKTGDGIWDVEVFAPDDPGHMHKKNSYASPTPIHEDGRIYAHFGYLGTACLDAKSGSVRWRQESLRYAPVHGTGGSPILVGDKLIFHCDGATSPYVVALHKKSGEVAWKTDRNVEVKRPFSFSTPLAVRVGPQTQIISPGSGAVIAYDPDDGREIWRFRYGEGYSVVPRPVFAHGLVFVCSGFNRANLFAIRADGRGDVTGTHLAWKHEENMPKESSLIAVDDLLFVNDDRGVASCFDARTGALHWQERLAPGSYSSSPVYADGRIYFQSGSGGGTVIAPEKTFTKLGENDIGDRVQASYAIAGNAIFLRTEHALFRIEKPSPH